MLWQSDACWVKNLKVFVHSINWGSGNLSEHVRLFVLKASRTETTNSWQVCATGDGMLVFTINIFVVCNAFAFETLVGYRVCKGLH